MNFKKIPINKGFTLVEMVLYVALCSIILLTLSSFFSSLLESRVRSQATNEVNQQGFQVMSLITRTIRNSRSIQVPAIASTSSVLSLTTGDPTLNPTIFSASGTKLMIKEGTNVSIPLTNGRVIVSGVSFQNISSSSSTDKVIRISFTLDYTNPLGRNEYAFRRVFTGSATLR